MKKYLLILFFYIPIIVFPSSDSQIEIRFSHNDIVERNFIDIGFLIMNEGKDISRTQGLLRGNIGWNRVNVDIEPKMDFNRGQIRLNHDSLLKNNYRMKITVNIMKGLKNYQASFIKEFPVLQNLTVLNSSLVTQGGNYLILRGVFTNGVSRTIHRRSQYPGFKLSHFKASKNDFKQLQQGVLMLTDNAYFEDSIPVRICHVSGVCATNKVQLIINSQKDYVVRGKTGTVGTSAVDGNGLDGETPEPIIVLIYQDNDKFYYQIQIDDKVENRVAGLKSKIKIRSYGGNGGNGARLRRNCSSEMRLAEGGNAGDGGDIYVYYFGQMSAIYGVFDFKSIGGKGGQGGYLEYCNKLPLGGYNGNSGVIDFIKMEQDEVDTMKKIFNLE
jgi:hypothetical protein